MYDITDNSSFVKVKNWVKELRSQLGKSVTLAIIGNKVDLEKSRAVNKEEALRYAIVVFLIVFLFLSPFTLTPPRRHSYAQSVGAKHYDTSAKLNKGLEELFLDLTRSASSPSPAQPHAPPHTPTTPAPHLSTWPLTWILGGRRPGMLEANKDGDSGRGAAKKDSILIDYEESQNTGNGGCSC